MPRSLNIVMGMALCLNLMSCDLFKTRSPEEPSQHSSNYIPPTDPSIVLQNMVNAFKDGDSFNYGQSFSEASFNFAPSSNAKSKYVIDWTAWNKQQEKNYFDKVQTELQNSSQVTLVFTQTSYGIPSDSCDVTTQYQLNVPLKNPGVVKTFKGLAQFQLVRDSKNGNWSIQKWIDSDPGSTASDSTWSDLKGAFAQ